MSINFERIDIAVHNLEHVINDIEFLRNRNYFSKKYLNEIKSVIEDEIIQKKKLFDSAYFKKTEKNYNLYKEFVNYNNLNSIVKKLKENLRILEELSDLLLNPVAKKTGKLHKILIIDDEFGEDSNLREKFCRENKLKDITDSFLENVITNGIIERYNVRDKNDFLNQYYKKEYKKKNSYRIENPIAEAVFLSGVGTGGTKSYLKEIKILERFEMSKFSAVFVDMIFYGENLGNKILGHLYSAGINRSTEIFILSQIAKNKGEIRKKDFNKSFLLSILNQRDYVNQITNSKFIIDDDILENITWEEFEIFAKNGEPVLIIGDTGTGKEIIAKEIYKNNSRFKGTFLAKNVGEISDNGIKDFSGTVKGAFTDAEYRKGWFELADNGVLLLDEIGDLNKEAQKSLLRIIENREVLPLGYIGHPKKFDVKLVIATGVDLENAVKNREFREDLFYRISLQIVRLKPLVKRKQKHFKALFKYFMDKHSSLTQGEVIDVENVDFKYLKSIPWKGNVREFEFLCKRALILKYKKLEKEDINKLLNL